MYIPRGLKEASGILEKGGKYLIYYDPDIDGLISGDLIYRFLTAFKRDFVYYINDNREHGIKLTEKAVEQLKGYTIICVDAFVSVQEIEYLTSKDINIINIDHHNRNESELVHIKQDNGCEGVVINNQYEFEPKEYRFLSGAGVVYYVLNAIYPGFCGLDEKSLVGLSLLSDIRPLENDIAADFLRTTYTHKSKLTEYLIDITSGGVDFGFGVKILDRNYIDYTFSPKVNALFRLNKGYEAIDLILGKYTNKLDLDVYKNLQNTVAGEMVENLEGEELSNLTYKYVDSSISISHKYNLSNFVGLVCSKVKNDGKTSVVFIKEGDKIIRGSLRGLSDRVDYLNLFRKHGFTCEGHKNAFGIQAVDFDKLDLGTLNEEIRILEEEYESKKYVGRVLEVPNLGFFLRSKNKNIGDYNNYVRDQNRLYIKYTGNIEAIKKEKRGKMIEYLIDGVPVLSFDATLSIEKDLILPLKERGNYMQFYLRKY